MCSFHALVAVHHASSSPLFLHSVQASFPKIPTFIGTRWNTLIAARICKISNSGIHHSTPSFRSGNERWHDQDYSTECVTYICVQPHPSWTPKCYARYHLDPYLELPPSCPPSWPLSWYLPTSDFSLSGRRLSRSFSCISILFAGSAKLSQGTRLALKDPTQDRHQRLKRTSC